MLFHRRGLLWLGSAVRYSRYKGVCFPDEIYYRYCTVVAIEFMSYILDRHLKVGTAQHLVRSLIHVLDYL